ncbi:hypothetical protein [Cellvibrio mixtus]|uniref:hypothetical protein n=1 Tax=Cellvibrio mixtus TaxID=39650 RepID=UPI0006946043|nr:hypothetical protein [Cellvibrio mixtus]
MATQPSLKNIENGRLNDITVAEAIAQFKDATAQIYDAVSLIGNASAASAKAQLQEGKVKALELEEKAEEVVKARPLVAVGVAFAAGWLVSRLLQR